MKKKLVLLFFLLAGTGIWLYASQGKKTDDFIPAEVSVTTEEKIKLDNIAESLIRSCRRKEWNRLEAAFAVTGTDREFALAEGESDPVKTGLDLLKQNAFQMEPQHFRMTVLEKNRKKMFLRMPLEDQTVLRIALLEQKGRIFLASVTKEAQEKRQFRRE